MALEHLEGTTYGPIRTMISAAKVAEYVAACGSEPGRWTAAAPPSYAGALLFVVAPDFLASDAVAGHTAVLIHADQAFTWHSPLSVGADVAVTGTVERVRARGGVDFVTFGAVVAAVDGTPLVDSTSTFVLGAEPAGAPPEERTEPRVHAAPQWDPIADPVSDQWPTSTRSASRLDLVRYAAASGDFNPIHFDHDSAVGAGLGGVVVHGLLMAAWLLELPARLAGGTMPIVRAKFRFRDALAPGVAASLSGELRRGGTEAAMALVRADDGGTLVTGQIEMRRE